jgi:hypothetical protein
MARLCAGLHQSENLVERNPHIRGSRANDGLPIKAVPHCKIDLADCPSIVFGCDIQVVAYEKRINSGSALCLAQIAKPIKPVDYLFGHQTQSIETLDATLELFPTS